MQQRGGQLQQHHFGAPAPALQPFGQASSSTAPVNFSNGGAPQPQIIPATASGRGPGPAPATASTRPQPRPTKPKV
ncbi:hypothetical protein PENSPDRAFT_657564 [Peniophora sp. CONT]|nr:hypothetical protein PENSPDRAFT_657564 [Peniophora sp. CONT]